MFEFKDRISAEGYSGRKKITRENGTSEYVFMENADKPVETGTPINRVALMALQGFQAKETVFNPDGSITETNSDGHTLKTTFNNDGSITETFTGEKTITKTTSFNDDDSISEVIS